MCVSSEGESVPLNTCLFTPGTGNHSPRQILRKDCWTAVLQRAGGLLAARLAAAGRNQLSQ